MKTIAKLCMKILAIEFSSSHRSVAVLERPEVLGRAEEVGGRSAIALIERALEQAQCEREQIAVIAVGLGPGSYTGIRGAIALAQGWQLGRGIKLLGVSSVECLASQAQASGMHGLVNIVIDAQRNEFYLASYQIDGTGARPVQALHLATFAKIEELARRGEKLIGPDIAQYFPGATNLCPDATALGQLAFTRDDFLPGEKLEPIYLRETTFKKAPPPRNL